MTNLTNKQAFDNHITRLTAKGADEKDIKSIAKWAHEGACNYVEGALDGNTIASITNQKAVKRLAQAVSFIAGDTVGAFDRATALIVAAIALSKDKVIDFKTMRFAMGGTGDENTVHIKGVSRAELQKYLKTIPNEGTRLSQCSRTVGTGGFLTALGVTRSASRYSFEIVNRNHPILLAYASRLENIGDATFELITKKK